MLYNEDVGHGPQLVFLHGNSQSSQVWQEVFVSEALCPFSLIAPDLPGHGRSFRSTAPAADYTLNGLARHTLHFLDRYDQESYILIGASLGTNIIGELSPFPSNCRGVFLISPMIIGQGMSPADLILPNPTVNGFFMSDPIEQQIDDLLAECFYDKDSYTLAQYKDWFVHTDAAFRASLGQCIAQGQWIDEIGNISRADIPVAIVFGAQDKFVNPAYLNAVHLNLWRNKIHLVERAGHAVQADQPELLAQLLSEFAADCFK